MEAELKRILRAARRYWWVAVVACLILAPTAYLAGRATSTVYVARSQLLVTPGLAGVSSIIQPDSTTETFRTLVTSGPVLDAVILERGLDMTRQDLVKKVTPVRVPGTNIIEIQVRDGNPRLAADINNSISRHAESKVFDLTYGQIQRNLSDLTAEVQSQRDQLVVIETRLATIDVPENEENNEVQAEISSLRSQRLALQQTISDLEVTIRTLRSEIASTNVPIAIIETANVPDKPEGATPLVLGVIGGLIGLGAGALFGLWREYSKTTVQDVSELGGLASDIPFTSISAQGIADPESDEVGLLAARIVGLQEVKGRQLAVVSARPIDSLSNLEQTLKDLDVADDQILVRQGLLTNPREMAYVGSSVAGSVIAFRFDETDVNDVKFLLGLLKDMNVPVALMLGVE